MIRAAQNCRTLDPQATRLACSRAFESDGSKIAIRSAMMPITTSSSTSVKAGRRREILLSLRLDGDISCNPFRRPGRGVNGYFHYTLRILEAACALIELSLNVQQRSQQYGRRAPPVLSSPPTLARHPRSFSPPSYGPSVGWRWPALGRALPKKSPRHPPQK